jgi:predicted dehydrogenase
MTNVTPEQRALGRDNANTALGLTRRDFLRGAAAAPALGAFYLGYKSMGEQKPVRAAIIGTGNEGCDAMIRQHNRDYLNFIGFCDIRPSNQEKARKQFLAHEQYTKDDVKQLRQYTDQKEMFDDPDVEVVVIALPLWLHAPVAIEALRKGKHVFCEKLMAHNVGQCKEMVRVAHETNRLLAIGHQRHYSVLYDNANYLVQNGHLGEIRHIRALWHRNNGTPMYEKDANGNVKYDPKTGDPIARRDKEGRILYFDGWKPGIPPADERVDYAKYGYKSLDELVRWRLYNRTGAGLMAELGSHQLDACSIFLGKKHPIAVLGTGGKLFYTDDREVEDHVFVTFEFPGQDYVPGSTDKGDHVVVTYSSINTNEFDTWGEQVMGTRGTLVVDREKELLFYKELDRNVRGGGPPKATTITVEAKGAAGKPVIETTPSASGPSTASALGGLATTDPSRGYREELEHFAYCVRHGDAKDYHAPARLSREDLEKDAEAKALVPRCRGEVALADAVIALTSNLAMKEKRRIEFQEAWFDYKSPEVPDGSSHELARRG